jgi:hypothetical protein
MEMNKEYKDKETSVRKKRRSKKTQSEYELVDKFYTIYDIKREIGIRGTEEVSRLTGFPKSMINSWMMNSYSPTGKQGDKLRKALFPPYKVWRKIPK